MAIAMTKTKQIKSIPDIEQGQKISKDTVCLEVHLAGLTMRRKMSSKDVVDSEQTDAEMIHVNKDLIDQDELREIRKRYGQLRQWLYSRSVPASILRSGMYLIPLALIEEIEDEIKRYTAERNELVDSFIDRYPGLVQAARQRLK